MLPGASLPRHCCEVLDSQSNRCGGASFRVANLRFDVLAACFRLRSGKAQLSLLNETCYISFLNPEVGCRTFHIICLEHGGS